MLFDRRMTNKLAILSLVLVTACAEQGSFYEDVPAEPAHLCWRHVLRRDLC